MDMKFKSTTGIPLVLALSVFAGSAFAQVGQSTVPDLPDELSEEMEKRLVEGGIIDRQARIGEDVLILRREGDRIKALEEVIDSIGLEGFRAMYPEIADEIDSSPLALRSQIEVVNLIRELEEAIKGPEPEEPVEGDVPVASNEDEERPGFIEMDIAPAGTIAGATQMTDREIEKLREEERATARAELEREQAMASQTPAISLREIYGSGSEVYAIIAMGADRVRVRAGDTLPGGLVIRNIGMDTIDVIDESDEIFTISIRG
ncbi:MAG: hypothetical protein ABJN42_29095 [Roseibium sp.]|uniref:hypothetical protein n=1 Tax=Roseibium sp. TaxID=1936156 RepID=UPI003296E2CC